jgi:ParB family chromosome partitioning protein
MARALARERRGAKESDYAAEFESPALLTLGILYEENRRFSGGAYQPMLRKLDRFAAVGLGASLRSREGHAARIADIDRRVGTIIERLKARGFRSPYLRAYVVARVNPVRWTREKPSSDKPPMALGEALTRMGRSIRDFDVDSVKSSDLAVIAAVAPPEVD